MAFNPDSTRIQQLEQQLQAQLTLLHEIEQSLLMETRPTTRTQLQQDATKARETYEKTRKEYDTLRGNQHTNSQTEARTDQNSGKEDQPLSESPYKYDAFLSYRRQEPDKAFARTLLKQLEADGYRVAIDERDFVRTEPFLSEMERCVKESRFTLVVASPRYFESGNTQEEAIICKVLDMSERKRRLLPLIIEAVTMPTWLYLITGINYTDSDPLVPPYDQLKETLQNP